MHHWSLNNLNKFYLGIFKECPSLIGKLFMTVEIRLGSVKALVTLPSDKIGIAFIITLFFKFRSMNLQVFLHTICYWDFNITSFSKSFPVPCRFNLYETILSTIYRRKEIECRIKKRVKKKGDNQIPLFYIESKSCDHSTQTNLQCVMKLK